MNKIISIITWLLVAFAGVLVIAFLLPVVPLTKDMYQIVIVRSGSMEPTIPTGSLVAYAPAEEYQVDDIVVFLNASTADKVVTIHRIVEEREIDGETQFITKGDNNETADTNPLAVSEMLGKVFITIPTVGYIVNWMQTTTGRFVLIVLPLALVAYHEIHTWVSKKNNKQDTTSEISE